MRFVALLTAGVWLPNRCPKWILPFWGPEPV